LRSNFETPSSKIAPGTPYRKKRAPDQKSSMMSYRITVFDGLGKESDSSWKSTLISCEQLFGARHLLVVECNDRWHLVQVAAAWIHQQRQIERPREARHRTPEWHNIEMINQASGYELSLKEALKVATIEAYQVHQDVPEISCDLTVPLAPCMKASGIEGVDTILDPLHEAPGTITGHNLRLMYYLVETEKTYDEISEILGLGGRKRVGNIIDRYLLPRGLVIRTKKGDVNHRAEFAWPEKMQLLVNNESSAAAPWHRRKAPSDEEEEENELQDLALDTLGSSRRFGRHVGADVPLVTSSYGGWR